MTDFALHRAALVGGAVLLTASGALTPALAQESGPQTERALERITITGDPDRIREVPGSAQVLDRSVLDRHSYSDPHRILRAVPGVNVAEEEGFGQFPHISMRGTPPERNSRVTIMEDGVPVAPAPYSAPAAYYFPPMSRMDRVEVLKGSSSIRHGPYTTGGAINMLSTPIPGQLSGKADVLFGSNNGRRVHANLGGTVGQWGWLVEGLQEGSDGFKQLDNPARGPNQPDPNTGFDRRNLLTKLRWNSDPSAELYQEVELKFANDERSIQDTYLGLTAQDFSNNPFRRYRGSQFDEINTSNDLYQLRHYIQFNQNVDMSTSIYRTETVRNWYKLHEVDGNGDGSFQGITPILDDPDANDDALSWIKGDPNNPDARGAVRANNREYYGQGIDLRLGYLYDAIGWNHELDVGLRFHQDEEDRFQWQDLYSMQNGYMVLESREEFGETTNRLTRARAVATYLQNTARRGPWAVTAGLRLEDINIRREDWSGPSRSGGNRTQNDSNDYRVLIPGVGATYAIDQSWSVLAGVHKGFAPGGASPDDEEEQSINYEAGFRFQGAATQAEVIGFYNDYSNINIECTAVGGGCGSADIGDTVAAGEVEIYGVEALLLHDLGAARGWRYNVPVRVGYTLTQSRFKQDIGSTAPNQWANARKGDSIPEIPEHQVNVGVGVGQSAWQVNLNANYVSGAQAKADPALSRQKIESRLLLDLSAEYRVHTNARLFAAVENLTDETYVAHFRPAGARPGKSRELWAGVKLDF
ncbi:Fe(3+) dicitrate transport protein [Natronocella acetinitrilica]|uniref:Fe(3+) dicitrate transport protein n=1 Tax=Natronocella acetinitrilica TaxID=414046 RepID=A0AAE3G590_9GAMM|nr:TonB-dependent receptor [Natronocella acetinitrilica]MCP1676096.1 Fe(3+) dicitrate transport protein [Natronocella acetinitrilica]